MRHQCERSCHHGLGQGWPCRPDEVSGFRGPGRKHDLCPQATLEALRAWSHVPATQHPVELHEVARASLRVWRSRGDEQPHMFDHGLRFKIVKWPTTWYDIHSVLDTLGRHPTLWTGPMPTQTTVAPSPSSTPALSHTTSPTTEPSHHGRATGASRTTRSVRRSAPRSSPPPACVPVPSCRNRPVRQHGFDRPAGTSASGCRPRRRPPPLPRHRPLVLRVGSPRRLRPAGNPPRLATPHRVPRSTPPMSVPVGQSRYTANRAVVVSVRQARDLEDRCSGWLSRPGC